MFECGFYIPELKSSTEFQVKAEDMADHLGGAGLWNDLYNRFFADGQPTLMVAQPTVAGIYTLERIE